MKSGRMRKYAQAARLASMSGCCCKVMGLILEKFEMNKLPEPMPLYRVGITPASGAA
tara:strand:- start:2505 stop:2675 length:171 start_codon:yes stop_codon:yes gene_type:complete